MANELNKDWVQLSQIMGQYQGNPTVVAVDASGNIVAVIKDPVSGNYVTVDDKGFLSSVMKGTDGTNLRTIAVDADGRILGVFQGQYGSTFKTFQTDEQGRLIAILTDPQDVWGYFRVMGFGEFSARLNPIFALDRRGDVIWWKTFDNGTYDVDLVGYSSGYSFSLYPWLAFWGQCSLKGTTSGGSPNIIVVRKKMPILSQTCHGVSFLYSVDDFVLRTELIVDYVRGGNEKLGKVRLDYSLNKISLWKADQTWETVGDMRPCLWGVDALHHCKLVINPVSGKYVRLLIDDVSYDLSQWSLFSSVVAGQDYFQGSLLVEGKTGYQGSAYISSIIFTHNEPN